MRFFKSMFQRTGALLGKAPWLRLTRFSLPSTGPARDVARTAMAGMILFGIAGAGLGARGGFNTFRVDGVSAGATVSVGWGYGWLVWAAAGLAAGAMAGTLAGYLANLRLRERGAAVSLLVIGALGGVLAGATWGTAVARERVVHVRAQPTSAAPLTPSSGPSVSIVTGPIRLSGRVDRDFNIPLLTFMLLGGTVVGALAARGLAESMPVARHADESQPRQRGFSPVSPQLRPTRAHAGAA